MIIAQYPVFEKNLARSTQSKPIVTSSVAVLRFSVTNSISCNNTFIRVDTWKKMCNNAIIFYKLLILEIWK